MTIISFQKSTPLKELKFATVEKNQTNDSQSVKTFLKTSPTEFSNNQNTTELAKMIPLKDYYVYK